MKTKFKCNEEPIISCRDLLNACQNLQDCYYNVGTFILGMYISIGRKTLESNEFAESLIYRTYETNSSSL